MERNNPLDAIFSRKSNGIKMIIQCKLVIREFRSMNNNVSVSVDVCECVYACVWICYCRILLFYYET